MGIAFGIVALVRRDGRVWILCVGLLVAQMARVPSSATAEVPGDFAASVGLSGADGRVHAQTSVRLSLSSLPGADHVAVMSAPVQARMDAVRTCFGRAMKRDANFEGRVVLKLEAAARGKATAEVTRDETGDAKLVECLVRALGRTDLRAVNVVGAGVLVALELSNATVRMRARMDEVSETLRRVQVRQVAGGRVQTDGGTYGGEVRFELSTSAFARPTLERLHRELSAHVAGLLDCRRKASRRGVPAEGAMSVHVSVDRERRARTRTVTSELASRTAPQCVGEWVTKNAGSGVGVDGASELALTVHFAR